MTSGPGLTDEMKAKVGMTHEPVIFEIEKGAVRRFVQAVEDPNPLWVDEEYSRKTPYGGIVCPRDSSVYRQPNQQKWER